MMRGIFFTFFLIFTFLNGSDDKNILLLNSYHQGYVWSDNITKGVQDKIKPYSPNYTLYVENMDTKKYHTKEYYDSLYSLYKSKYKNIKFDLILASDNNAFDFLREHRDDIFGDIPVAFCGVNNFHDAQLEGYDNYTGIAQLFSIRDTINTILKLHPYVKKIYFINDHLTTGREVVADSHEVLKEFQDKVKIEYADNQTLYELQNKVESLDDDTAILMGVYFADKNNVFISNEEFGDRILDKSNVPVYCLSNYNISKGVIGGKVISGYYQGAIMAKLGLQILSGVDADTIDVIKDDGANRFIFNKTALDKFGVAVESLPHNSDIIKVNISFYEKYYKAIVAILIAAIVLFLLIYIVYKKRIFHEKNILYTIVYGPIIAIPVVVLTVIYTIIHNNNEVFEKNIENLKIEYINEQKHLVQKEVEDTVKNVNFFYQRDKEELEKRLKDRVKEAYTLAQTLYNKYKGKKSDEEIKNIIVDALAQIRFFNGRGYYFINTNKGIGVLFEGVSKLKSKPNLINFKDIKGNFIIQDQIDLIREKKEGYSIKYFRKLDGGDKEYKKLSYVKLFEPFDWHIGTGEYLIDYYKDLKSMILKNITNTRYSTYGYMFAFDSKGIIRAHGVSKDLIGTNMIDEKDSRGVSYIKKMIENAKKNTMNFTEYEFINPKTNRLDMKFAYAEYIPYLDLIVSSGAYLSDMNQIIQKKKLELQEKNDVEINSMLIISFVVMFIFLVIFIFIANIVRYTLTKYQKKIEQKNQKLLELNNSLEERIKEEVKKSKEKDSIMFQQSKMATMGEMLENIAHQWRQPLSSISTAASGIKLQLEFDNIQKETFEKLSTNIVKSVEYLSNTINDFRNFFRKDKERQHFILHDSVEDALNIIKNSLIKYKINVQNNCAKGMEIYTYKGEFMQVLLNLFNNAKDALNETEPKEKIIKIDVNILDEEIELIVQDNAGGVPEYCINKIFDAYFTTKHKSQGTGLGLHMSYQIIVGHIKGSIVVKNEPINYNGVDYIGAKFILRLPKEEVL